MYLYGDECVINRWRHIHSTIIGVLFQADKLKQTYRNVHMKVMSITFISNSISTESGHKGYLYLSFSRFGRAV